MKLVIGSSNFGTSYGLSGLRYKQGFKNSDLSKLSKLIKNYSLEYFDTSYNYKSSHSKISKVKNKKKIITKLSFKTIIKKKNPLEKLTKLIHQTKIRHKLDIYALLIHDLFLLTKKEAFQSFVLLKKLKKKILLKNLEHRFMNQKKF